MPYAVILPVRIIRQAGGALEFVNGANDPSGISCDHGTGWNVFGNDGTGADKGALADGDEGEQGYIDADLGAFSNGRATHACGRVFTSRMNVVGNGDARGQKDLIFNDCKLRHIAIGVNLDAISYLAPIVHNGIGPDCEMVADDILLSDHHIVARCQMRSNRCALINDGATADLGVASNDEFPVTDISARGIAEEYVLVDRGAFSDRT